MAGSPFHRLNSAKMVIFLEPKRSASCEYYHPLSPAQKKS